MHSLLVLLLAQRSGAAQQPQPLRFAVGDRVEANLGDRWETGTVAALHHKTEDGSSVPYVIKLDSGGGVVAPHDDDSLVRRGAPLGESVSLRFAVGDRVEANIGVADDDDDENDRWVPGTIIARYYRDGDEAVVSPYQIGLDSGGAVYAPRDDDHVVRRERRPTKDDRLRFAVGDRVECNIGDRWAAATIVGLNFYSEGGVTSPFQARLDAGGVVFAPSDDDGVIRKLHRPVADASLRFQVGDRVECNVGGRWAAATVVALSFYAGGATSPYLARLDDGEEVIAPRDDDSVVRRAPGVASQPAGLRAGAGGDAPRAAATMSPPAGKGFELSRAEGRVEQSRTSKLSQKRVGQRASLIGTRNAGSKLGRSRRGQPQRARAHKSTRPEPREEAMARWRAVSSMEL